MKKTNTYDLVLAALCAALTAVVAPFSIAIGPISLTLSVFAVLFTGAMLRPGWAFAAQVVYIAIGAIGLPVFSGFKSGPQVLLGATGGYLVAYPLMALVLSLVCQHFKGFLPRLVGVILVHVHVRQRPGHQPGLVRDPLRDPRPDQGRVRPAAGQGAGKPPEQGRCLSLPPFFHCQFLPAPPAVLVRLGRGAGFLRQKAARLWQCRPPLAAQARSGGRAAVLPSVCREDSRPTRTHLPISLSFFWFLKKSSS